MPESPDFSELLNFDSEMAIKPPPQPSGTYRVLVKSFDQVISDKKKTKGIAFKLTDWEPMADVDTDQWKEFCDSPVIDPNAIERTETFWLTKKAMYRCKDFCVLCGAEPAGPMGKLIADACGNTVLAVLVQTVDGENVYNEIQSFAVDN
jgi:hypothetical protein